MTMRERILAVINGDDLDRVPFVQYDSTAGPNSEIWDALGRDELGLLRWTRVHRVERPNCDWHTEEFEQGGLRARRTVVAAPKGRLTDVTLFEPVLGSGHIDRHFVQTAADYEILLSLLRDSVVVEDLAPLQQTDEQLGDDGLPLVAVERTPYQQLWIQWVSMEDLACHLVDCPDLVHACMDEMGRIQKQIFEIAARSPAPFVDFPDNITAPLIGEDRFRKYCVPYYRELVGMLDERDVPVFVHMDGDLKPLAGAIAESGIRGLDSFSPQPDNDTSAAEALELWPGMALFLNFPSSVHIAAPERIYQVASEILEQAGASGRLQIQVSENVPPGVWRTSFPPIVRAIHDYTD